MYVPLSGTNLFRALNLHLSDSDLKEVHSVHSLKMLNTLSALLVYFLGQTEPKIFRLVKLRLSPDFLMQEIAMSSYPATPVLKAEITRALDSRLCGRNFLTSR